MAKKSSFSSTRVLSPHYEAGASPTQTQSKSRYSRFNSRRLNNTARNLEGSLEKAEKSVRSALAVKPDNDGGNITEGANGKSKSPVEGDSSKFVQRSRFLAKSPVISVAKNMEYNVDFEPGPIGLKLEPVLKNGQKEFGCRVMRFVDNGKNSSPSQALKSGKINVGDVLTAVNGKNVTSKSYKEIVSLLKSPSSETEGRIITFRVPRSPAAVMPKTPASKLMNVRTAEKTKNSSLVDSVLTPLQTKNSKGSESPTMFSPSFVKKMTQSSVKDTNVLASPSKSSKPLSDILNTVMKNIAPMSTLKPTHVSSVLSKQIGQVLVGASSKEVDEAVHMKLELLTELSQAKASLGEQEKSMQMMTKIMDDIQKEKVAAQAEKHSIQGAFSEVQRAKVRFNKSQVYFINNTSSRYRFLTRLLVLLFMLTTGFI